jgi:hypothetical protein
MSLPEAILIVTVDVEEDNWGIENSETTVENIRMIPRLQNLFDGYGIKPTYLVTYPVVSSNWPVDIFSQIASAGKCEIGSHLHPWNTPPLKEDINERNSMLNNLPIDLQLEKLNVLTDEIQNTLGRKPKSFRAGRYGLGSETIKALIRCGYLVDSSVTPTMSWVSYGEGPTYMDAKTEPYWISVEGDEQDKDFYNSILEIPATIGFNRWPFEFCQKIFCRLQKDWLEFIHPIGILHHTKLLRKIWLSPEISSAEDMITLSKIIIKNGMQFLNLSFHSTSLLPGKSPFVKNKEELEQFFLKIEKLLEYLTSTTKLISLTLLEARMLFENRRNL